MKKQWSGEHDLSAPSVGGGRSNLSSAAAFHARITSMAMSGPSSNQRKHGFSLRRLFGGGGASSGGVRNNNPAPPPNRTQAPRAESDSQSESSFLGLADPSLIGHRDSFRMAMNAGGYHSNNKQLSSDSDSLSSVTFPHLKAAPLRAALPTTEVGGLLECPLCLLELSPDCFPSLSSCEHRACADCLGQYLRIEINESRVMICCPHCAEPLHPNDIRNVLNDQHMINKYQDFLLRRVLVTEPDIRWCPAPDCTYAVIASGCAGCPKLQCERPGCSTFFCYHCKQEWHPNQTCDAARAQRSTFLHSPSHHLLSGSSSHHPQQQHRSASVSFSHDSLHNGGGVGGVPPGGGDDIKMCPCCKALIVKMDDGSCNHLTCSVCGTEFCWLCMKEISDLHYLSPSGCTFWGKKPWSRKKKILWQLGMLAGAPVGIALIAGIALPAIVIGIPVWVGRKLFAKYNRQRNSNKHKRNLVVTSGVVTSILVSPMLAAIAVGIGVPILLAYVYGVVPISLCRSGGCGVTTSASGVRIEFDEEQEIAGVGGSLNGAVGGGPDVDTQTIRGVNPSIGEVSFGMSASLSLGSGCHLERVGYLRESDRESASNTAIAGHSLTGSIASNEHQLLHVVQADMMTNGKRASDVSIVVVATEDVVVVATNETTNCAQK